MAGKGLTARLQFLVRNVRKYGVEKDGLNLVAFSGGVDSTMAGYVVKTAFPKSTVGVLGISPSLSTRDRENARTVAAAIDLPLVEVRTHEGNIPEYISNMGQSCYHCKTTLYRTLNSSQTLGDGRLNEVDGENMRRVLFNGTNKDDLADATRVGLIAANEFGVISPLKQLTKMQVL